MQETSVSAEKRYSELARDRRPFLDRARQCAALTIPSIMPPEGFNKHSYLPTPYQSLGARGVRTLASKLLLSLFPQIPFFNYRLDDKAVAELGERRGATEAALASRERAVILEANRAIFKPQAFLAITHLIVTGNALVVMPKDPKEPSRMHRLDQYVVRRDYSGRLQELILEEEMDFGSLEWSLQQALVAQPQYNMAEDEKDGQSTSSQPVRLYTRVYWDPETSRWIVYQEIGGFLVPDSEGTYLKDDLPYLCLRLVQQPGEDYGRSYCEEYLGDLDSLEALSETLVEASAASARVIFMVAPNGTTNLQVVAKARNGDVISGNAVDVTAMQVQKQADLSVARAQAENIATRLSYAFLLHAAVQRQGDRVTAEEIRYMASELDDSLGGIYTLLATEFQLPLVTLLERRLEKRGGFPRLPEGTVEPVVVTGLEAIGRGHDQMNLKTFVAEIVQIIGPELALRYLNPMEFMSRSAAAYSIDTEGLIASEDEIKQREQAAQMQSLIQHLGPNVIDQLGKGGQEALKASVGGQQGGPPDGQ